MDLFLHVRDLRHERVNSFRRWSTVHQKRFLIIVIIIIITSEKRSGEGHLSFLRKQVQVFISNKILHCLIASLNNASWHMFRIFSHINFHINAT